ncbi:DNA primase [Caulobacter phage Percy]|uniref:DNA primase n=1 Tax=Caulobacter phage Percy TaxID=1701809 RepID=A0A0M4R444_9CAUD|nr:DNA primase [Caulobacter phage Percy]ALF01652.1 DNA primase [Caulobacter phage Percy]
MTDRLDPSVFLHLAQELAEGQSRTVHGCCGGKKLVVDHKRDGWGAYCYRCSGRGWVPKPPESLAQRIARLGARNAEEAVVRASLDLPTPANNDPRTWPLEARVWLYKVGFSNDDIVNLGFFYHARTKRVVMPSLNEGKLVYWQARGFDPEFAKYINPPVNPKPVAKYGSGPVLVLNEDMLSAAKVGMVTEAWSLLGTKISTATVAEIIGLRKPVVIWLDPDDAGRKGSVAVYKALTAGGVQARVVRTDADPKLHSKKEITHILGLDSPPIASPS